jgi:tetratricopeptide (TPR) repeat protein
MAATRGFSAVETATAYGRARILAERTSGVSSLDLFFGLHSSAHTRGEARRALALADQMLEIARNIDSMRALAMAHYAQGLSRHYLGDLSGARLHYSLAIEHYREEDFIGYFGRISPRIGSRSWSGANEWQLGFPDTALRYTNKALAEARHLKDPFSVTLTLNVRNQIYDLCGTYRPILESSLEMEAISRASGFPLWMTVSKVQIAYARARIGEIDDAAQRIREGIAELDAIGFHLARARFLGFLCRAQILDGALDDATTTIEQSLQPNPDQLIYRPESLRIRGELSFMKGNSEQAETDFHEALTLAQSMSARSYELRATMSLARLFAKQGRRYEARAMLADIYGWFTEGFDTADLKDAKSLLEELRT